MKKIFSLYAIIFAGLLSAETLFEVKDASNNKVLDVSTDGIRILNMGDTLMVISADGIRAYIQQDSSKGLSRAFSVTTTQSKGDHAKGQSKVFEIATDEGATFYNPSDNTDEIFSISKSGITANVNPSLNRDFEVNDYAAGKVGGGNLMKVSNKEVFETVNDSTMLWYKQKNAFRIGHVLITDPIEVGQASFASGGKNIASGMFSSAMGNSNFATGNSSVALGYGSVSTGDASISAGSSAFSTGDAAVALGGLLEANGGYSAAFNFENYANGYCSLVAGNNSQANGNTSFAMGYITNASGDYSTAFGSNTTSGGYNSTVFGSGTSSSGYFSFATGQNTDSRAYNSFVVGRYNKKEGTQTSWVSTDPLFVVGNGSGSANLSNAFEVKKNGVVIIQDLYNTTANNGTSKYVRVDSSGKLFVPAFKEDGDELVTLKNENQKLKNELEDQSLRITKLEEAIEKLLK